MAKNIYVGVGGKARKVKQLYVGVAGKARKVKKVYVGVGGKARLVYVEYIPVTKITLNTWDTGGVKNGGKSRITTINIFFNITPDNSTTRKINAQVLSNSNSNNSDTWFSVANISGNCLTLHTDCANADNTAKIKIWIDSAVCNITVHMHVKPLFINFRYTVSVSSS